MTTQLKGLTLIHQATNVKNAKLLLDSKKGTYYLVHYDTIILEVRKNNNVVKALKCSQSSNRAISQVCSFLNIDFSKLKLTEFKDFEKYDYSTVKKVNNDDFIKVINEEENN